MSDRPGRGRFVVLTLFGAILIRLATGAELSRYVRPGTRPLVIVAGAVAVILGLIAARHRNSPPTTSFTGRAAWLLLGPAIAVAVVSPPALGVLTANRAPVAPPQPSAGFPSLPSSGPVPIRLSDVVLRTVWHAESTLHGRLLTIVGFVSRAGPHGFVLSRLVITCCAADARPYDIDVSYSRRPPPIGQWVRTTGWYRGPSAAGAIVPAVRAVNVVAISPPANPYG